MTRRTAGLRCDTCGAEAPKWVGRCAACGAWGSLVETADGAPGGVTAAVPLASIEARPAASRSTGVPELDRVLGGGLVAGSVTLLGGEPGIGKSTLVLQALLALAGRGETCLLVSAEESAPQVRERAARLGPLPAGLLVLDETSLPVVAEALRRVRPAVCVVDSIQTVGDPDLASPVGSVAQVRQCAAVLTRAARESGAAVIVVGHVTKSGGLAGPRALEHLVDTVLSFEGDRHHALRVLRALKHRFGATGEVGLFEMTDAGMAAVTDPGALFLGDRRRGAPGSAVVTTVEGQRPLLVEVQALVCKAAGGAPRRVTQGVDASRVGLLLAVLGRRVGISVGDGDVFVSTVGGVRLSEPAADLGIVLALVSAATGRALPPDLVAIGEVGLAGDLRRVPHTPRRLAEAARLGFRAALVVGDAPSPGGGLELVRVTSVVDALGLAGLLGASDAGRQRTTGAGDGAARAGAARAAAHRRWRPSGGSPRPA